VTWLLISPVAYCLFPVTWREMPAVTLMILAPSPPPFLHRNFHGSDKSALQSSSKRQMLNEGGLAIASLS
jgi:hypothetical protein